MRKSSCELRENALEPHEIATRLYSSDRDKKKILAAFREDLCTRIIMTPGRVVPRELIVIKTRLSLLEDQKLFLHVEPSIPAFKKQQELLDQCKSSCQFFAIFLFKKSIHI